MKHFFLESKSKGNLFCVVIADLKMVYYLATGGLRMIVY
jgi:hypothetical protein